MTEVLQALEKFRDEVVKEARSQLAAKGKNSSGALSKSIQGEVKQMPNSIGIYFKMLPVRISSSTPSKVSTGFPFSPSGVYVGCFALVACVACLLFPDISLH